MSTRHFYARTNQRFDVSKVVTHKAHKSTPAEEIATLKAEIKKAESWIVFYSGVSAKKRMSEDYCKMQIETYGRLIRNLKAKLGVFENRPSAEVVVKALSEVADMTPETEKRLNDLIERDAPKAELIAVLDTAEGVRK